MNKEHIPVITDREELYDKCENMEQLYDKYYLPLLDIYYRKTYELQQQNKKYKEVIDKAIEWVKDWTHGANDWFEEDSKPSELLNILKEVE